ncbi:MAG: TolC family protein [Proteobacteria bacterium]|nr:TolC family protein [Pseudomonadota bacterium]
MNKINIFWIILVFIIPFSVYADEPLIKNGEQLSMKRCIEIALKIQPTLMRDRYVVMQKEAQLGQARASYFPKVDTSANFTRNYPVSDTKDPLFSGLYLSQYNKNLGSATLNQTIYDFGRTPANVFIKKLNLESSRFDLDTTAITVSNNVKSSYYGVLKTKKSRDVNIETVARLKQHFDQAVMFFEAGKKPKYDVTKAEVDLSNAKLNLIGAENDLKIAWIMLNNAMGIDLAYEYQIEDSLFFEKYELDVEDIISKAYKNRPDMKSLIAQKDSAEKAVELAKREYYPQLSGVAAYNAIGSQYPLGQGFQAGITMSMNIFDGFLTTNKVAEAIANKKTIDAKIDSLKLQILLDVKQAYLNLLKAKDSIANTEVQVRQATENLELANLRYGAGIADPLEVTDASVSYSQAKLSNISALYDYKIAQANIEKAMGNK